MCSRYFLDLQALLELEKLIDYQFERNLLLAKDYYPGDQLPIITIVNNKLTIQTAKWGFKAFENKLIINARSETLLEKPIFNNEVFEHRCIIPARGFYEWDQHKHRFTFVNEDGPLMFLAGIYRNVDQQKEVTIITTSSNDSMQGIHHRMPLILTIKQMYLWLSINKFGSVLNLESLSLKILSGALQTSLF